MKKRQKSSASRAARKAEKIKKYFNQKEKLRVKNKKYAWQIKKLAENFLDQDLDESGDITSKCFITENKLVAAEITAKQKGIVCGIEEVKLILSEKKIKIKIHKKDGDSVKRGDLIAEIKGGVKDVLEIERLILNVMQRLSGIATQTREIVKKMNKSILITPTRKTNWGMPDKRAVVIGGGGTHRLGLHDFILIKDNHILFARGGLKEKINEVKRKKIFWEIEAKTGRQAVEFAKLCPDALMLDNFKPALARKTIKKLKKINPDIIFEASGGINLKNVVKYKDIGFDIISLGCLTHSPKAIDISLNIKK